MQLQNKHKIMLSLLTVLMLIRFVIVPIFSWQDEKVAKIQNSKQRIAKTENVIARLPQITSALKKLQLSNKNIESFFTKKKSLAAFKLQQQQQIESLFTTHGIKVKNFNWAADIPGKISESRAKITFEGKTSDFARLHLAIARLPTLIKVAEWTANIKKKRKRKSKKANNNNSDNVKTLGTARGSLLLIAYNINPQTSLQTKE